MKVRCISADPDEPFELNKVYQCYDNFLSKTKLSFYLKIESGFRYVSLLKSNKMQSSWYNSKFRIMCEPVVRDSE